jgi:hypothetical protein
VLHWEINNQPVDRSLEKGLFNNDVSGSAMFCLSFSQCCMEQFWVGIFGLLAAVASFRSGWKATALRSEPVSEPTVDKSSVQTPGSSTLVDAASRTESDMDS